MKCWTDRLMQSVVFAAGGLVLLMVLALLVYLGGESRYALDQTFPYGYHFALQPATLPDDYELSADPYATVLTANIEGADGLDEKEEGILAPTLDVMDPAWPFATASTPDETGDLYRDDWRIAKRAEAGDVFRLFAFAGPEHKEPTMALAWAPHESFLPARAPYTMTLRLVSAPKGIDQDQIVIDLKERQSGRILLPSWIAQNDADRNQGYVFEFKAEPVTTTTLATIRNFFRTDWAPTVAYPRYGFVPLLFGTALMTLLAVLIATPISVAVALYMSEVSPSRVREWLKPVLELLASVPTVVLGYFGLMLVAPGLQRVFAAAFTMESGRMMLTAALVLAILLIPTVATLAEDALRNVPQTLRDGADAIGLTRGEGLRKILIPAARAGLIGATLLGLARGVGETMIIWMLSGGTAFMPRASDPVETLFKPTRGIPDTIGIEMGNVAFEGVHYGHLFLIGLVLFILTLIINLAGYRLARRSTWQA